MVNKARHKISEDKPFSLPREEEKILEFWKKNKIFEKSLEKSKKGKPFTFYDGPPFATGLPHYGHILASTIKDVIPRYQTMRGRFVRRRWGWDCHGLPIEEIVERKLGISGKKEIESKIGIAKFNETCRSAVLTYVAEWRKTVERIARWVEFDNSYKTMDRDYMESVWWAFKEAHKKGLVYEGRKVLMYCPRCETPVSNFEVAMDDSYKDVTDESAIVKFKIKNPEKINLKDEKVYVLAWTTTPWTLPGNVALAVNEKINYTVVSRARENYIVAEALTEKVFAGEESKIVKKLKGKNLVGLRYEQLFSVPAVKSDKTFKVYPADFVSTEEGTGIVHTAVVYGEDDYTLGQKVGLPIVPLLDEKGKFNDKAPEFLRGIYFKGADKIVLADLEKRNLLFKKERHVHSYPHCWRCGNALFYNALPAWFINVQKIKKKLLQSNAKEVNWFPAHLKNGRYKNSVEQAPDWNISRNRYWGNPVPVWRCASCGESIVVGSIKELGLERNTFYFARHGEAENNIKGIISSYPEPKECKLTAAGKKHAVELAKRARKMGGIDLIFTSDILRTRQTAEIIGKILDIPVQTDERLREYNVGPKYNGKPNERFDRDFPYFPPTARWNKAPENGETFAEVQKRMIDFIQEKNKKFKNKRILIISHGDPLLSVQQYFGSEREYPGFAELFSIDVSIADLHRPYIDKIVLDCKKCGGKAKRTTEIFDSWVEAGSMPFAEYHYPFEQKEIFESRQPAQFVSEYIAQTRAWFYVMHVIGIILFGRAPFENVVTTGTILAENGSKMSKSKGNFPDPWDVINKYGADSLRFYLMNSVVMQADNLNFSVRDLESVYRKVNLILWNVFKYSDTYVGVEPWNKRPNGDKRMAILDKWIILRTNELVAGVTKHLDVYDTVRATRLIQEYVDDLSTWYVRRSRGRNDKAFFETLNECLSVTSCVIAPFMPYLAEMIYLGLKRKKGDPESVHLASWPRLARLPSTKLGAGAPSKLIEEMKEVRKIASLALAKRAELGIKVRQPLAEIRIKYQVSSIKGNKELLEILKDEVNVKKVTFDLKLKEEIELDTVITPELKEEGLMRELKRAIQELRQKAGLKPGQKIELAFELPKELKKTISRNEKFLKFEVGAKNISYKKSDRFSVETEAKIDGSPVWVGIKK